MRCSSILFVLFTGCTKVLGDRGTSTPDASIAGLDGAAPTGSVDLDVYCRHAYGAASTAESVAADVYGWRCTDGDGAHTVDMQDVCRFQLTPDAVAEFSDVHDKTSWRCSAGDSGYVRAGGLQLIAQCTAQYGSAATLVAVDTTENGWRCKVGSNTFAIDLQAACRREHSSNLAVAHAASDFDRDSWACYVPAGLGTTTTSASLEFISYCQTLFGPTATAGALEPNPYGWRCKVGSESFPIDVTDVCRREVSSRTVAAYSDFTSGFSWTCLSVPQT